jgi:hypothetical protein
MSPAFQELVIEHGLPAWQKQRHFLAWLNGHEWFWDQNSGVLSLRRLDKSVEVRCTTQALGSVSQMSETWTWIWANELAELDESLMVAARRLKQLGEERGIPELAIGEFQHAQANADLLALVAMELLNGEAYYRGTYLGGAGYLLIESGLSDLLPPIADDAEDVMPIAREAAWIVPNFQRQAIVSYLKSSGWQCEENAEILVARQGTQQVHFVFNDGNELLSAKVVSRKI